MLHQLLRCIMMLSEEYGILVRGGRTRGQLIHDDTLLVGPAMVEAYRLESKCAIYPRVILDEPLKKSFEENIEHYIQNYTNFTDIPSPDFIFKKEVDGWWYVDYIHPSDDYIYMCRTARDYSDYRSELLVIVAQSLKVPSPEVRVKYQWLADK